MAADVSVISTEKSYAVLIDESGWALEEDQSDGADELNWDSAGSPVAP